MKLTEEMEKMVKILKENDDAMKKSNSLYKSVDDLMFCL